MVSHPSEVEVASHHSEVASHHLEVEVEASPSPPTSLLSEVASHHLEVEEEASPSQPTYPAWVEAAPVQAAQA